MKRAVPTLDDFQDYSLARGYNIYLNGKLNIVGWRNTKSEPNQYEDWLSVYKEKDGKWSAISWPITTYPGVYFLLSPINKKGTAILVPGQYTDTYKLGIYKGYYALKQVRPVRVYRDTNKDSAWDEYPESIDVGMFGIHIHKAGMWSKLVGNSSAGCQVFQKSADYKEFIDMCSVSATSWEDRFTYTLMEY